MARAVCTEFRWQNGRGQNMYGVEFLPAGGATAARGALLWHHGICEHSGRYAPVMQQLAEQGVAVYTFDAHGHGRSDPQEPAERCMISRFDDLVDDIYTFVSVVEQRRGSRLEPCVIGGQSMGALAVAHAVLRNQDRWAGLVLHSAAMGVVWTLLLRAQAAIGGLLAAAVPYSQLVPAVNPEDLHPDPTVVEAFKADPLIFHGNLRARSANTILNAMRALDPKVPSLTLPFYAVHGVLDKTTSIEAVESITARVKSGDVTFKKVEDGYHELLMGEERAANGAALADWVKSRCAAYAAARARALEDRPASGKL